MLGGHQLDAWSPPVRPGQMSPLEGTLAATPSSNQFFAFIQYLCSGLYHLMPRKIELTAEYNPTFFKGYYDGFWPHTAIFPIFAGFEDP